MKKSFTIILAITGIAFMLISFGMSYDILSSNGKSGKTNSPGEGNCTSCHNSFAVNTGGGSTTITSPDLTGVELYSRSNLYYKCFGCQISYVIIRI